MAIALIGLGANLDDRAMALRDATQRVGAHPAVRQLAASGLIETAAIGGPASQPRFLNAALLIETDLSAGALFEVLQACETALGRQQGERWGPRTVDLDLLLYDDRVVDSPDLVVPHPRMAFRRFVLVPASEIAGHMIHPTSGWPLSRLLSHLDRRPDYVAVVGGKPADRRSIAERAAHEIAARLLPLSPPVPDETQAGPIKWLQAAARLLGPDNWPGDRPTISDFWFDEPVCTARPADSSLAASVEQAWAAHRNQIVQPKLIVWLDHDNAIATAGDNVAQWLAQQPPARRAFYNHILRHDVGPTLRIDPADPTRCAAEIAAAVGAMQSI
jgi:2-amino-4-hydroxy-6-hydroxymethyldihydropteridine diphosphokinase